ncbi:hypothetical protein DUNSADRAFT_9677 [Dunaliella salina]|uniref:Uncharacterized protein n=1 Tax=Dunaliella salina TaxID=3046 RepID=A0ABQ7GH04_DUNSA|nr:hypothetical protein DUNSADRAFT_9677 [Dunaliella salina]|eukprot:KAF5833882.1 hypothetical protein DUNSADRAFT_9677 [Dunaliella salina]
MQQGQASPARQGPQHELMSVLLAAAPDEFEALMQLYFPTELDSELEELEITAPSGGILREAAATEVAAQRWQRKSMEAASKAEVARSRAKMKAGEAMQILDSAEAESMAYQANLDAAPDHTRLQYERASAAKVEAQECYAQYRTLVQESRNAAQQALEAAEYARWLELAGMRQESAAALRKAKEWVLAALQFMCSHIP